MGPGPEPLLDGKTHDFTSDQGPLSPRFLPLRIEWLMFYFVVWVSIKRLLYWHSRPSIKIWSDLGRVQVIRNCKLSCAVKFCATLPIKFGYIDSVYKNLCSSDHKISCYANQKNLLKRKKINCYCNLVLLSFRQESPKELICPQSVEWQVYMFSTQIILILPSGATEIIEMELNKLIQPWKAVIYLFSISKVIYMCDK